MKLDSLQDLCEDIVAGVDGAIGCALVDLETGLPLTLKVKTGMPFDPEAMELLSAVGVAYFNDDGDVGEPSVDDAVQEIQTTTEDVYCFMSRVPDEAKELLILVTDRHTTNLGLGWMSIRQALSHIRAANASGDRNGAPGNSQPLEPTPRTPTLTDDAFAVRSRDRRSIWG